MNSKKCFLNLLVGLCVISIILCFSFSTIAAEKKSDIKFITVASGAGDWALVGAKIADIITKNFPGITATSIPGGATINLSRIQSGEAQIGIVHSFLPYQAYNGLEPFEGKHTKIRTMISLWKGYAHCVVPLNSDITSIPDLINKPYNVWVSKPGLGSNVLTLAILNAFGVTPEKIREIGGVVQQVGLADGAKMMKDRKLDFLMFPVVMPYSMLMDLSISPGIKLLPIEGEAREKLLNSLPGLTKGVIPANSYKNQDKDIQTIANFHQLCCSSDLPDDLVYNITATIIEKLPELRELSASLKAISVDNATLGSEILFHPGAEKYYIEHDMLKK